MLWLQENRRHFSNDVTSRGNSELQTWWHSVLDSAQNTTIIYPSRERKLEEEIRKERDWGGGKGSKKGRKEERRNTAQL